MNKGLALAVLASATFGCAAFLIGWLLNREEYEAFWIVFGVACARVFLPAILPGRFAAMFFALDIALLSAGFILGFWVGRSDWLYMHTTVKWMIMAMPALLIVGAPIAWWLNRFALARRITGPYCRGCRYHLKGVANWRCPECGRPFTLKELGVNAAELKAESREKVSDTGV